MNVGNATSGSEPIRNQDEKLREAARQLEGVFLAQLTAAMQATVEEGGFLGESQATGMWQQMFNDQISEMASGSMEGGLGQALYEQLRGRMNLSDRE